jgi:hypothetical protein
MKDSTGERSLLEALRESGFEVTGITTRDGKKVVTVKKTAVRGPEIPGDSVLPAAPAADG